VPDFKELAVTREPGTLTVPLPRFLLQCRVVESTHRGRELAQYRGVNGIRFPEILLQMSAEQIETLAFDLLNAAVNMKAREVTP
jgi:hypothetical protein